MTIWQNLKRKLTSSPIARNNPCLLHQPFMSYIREILWLNWDNSHVDLTRESNSRATWFSYARTRKNLNVSTKGVKKRSEAEKKEQKKVKQNILSVNPSNKCLYNYIISNKTVRIHNCDVLFFWRGVSRRSILIK